MSAQIYLIAPADTAPDALAAALQGVLDRQEVSALLLPRGQLGRERLQGARQGHRRRWHRPAAAPCWSKASPAWSACSAPMACTCSGDVKAVREAVAALKPNLIVGAGDVHSRDDAMPKGELEVDYILFGPLSGPIIARRARNGAVVGRDHGNPERACPIPKPTPPAMTRTAASSSACRLALTEPAR